MCSQSADGAGSGGARWEADTTDPNRFAGTVTITGSGETMMLGYSFVYDAMIINANEPDVPMTPLGGDCWSAEVKGDFMRDIADRMEVVFCQRGDLAYWTLLDTRGGAVRLPVWVSFTRS
ncbi:MAG: hypothetical protein DI498_05315 [Paracoccus denitrificans]|nr:MAG: hypothetical protein DI498_05315 [Paracoccus denitrificans]PZO84858.1 MAG: hypothetical protein DI633_05315 [Paracoccus denitrificans]